MSNLPEITELQEQLTEIQNRANYLTDQRNVLIQEAYKNGNTIAELSRATKVSRNTIYKIIRKEQQ